ncbi:MAG: hypothetical protein IJC99_05365 [Clostridia bacterium]|nr:hypothetical protein [Clostridia bacterium]
MGRAEDWKRYHELDDQEKELKKKRDELQQKIRDLLYAEGMTDRKRKLIKKYDNASFTNSFLCIICPILFLFENSPLSLSIRFWPIRKSYIIPKAAYVREIQQLDERIRSLGRSKMMYLKGPSDAAVEIVKKQQQTRVEVTIEYDVAPGDCGDCY